MSAPEQAVQSPSEQENYYSPQSICTRMFQLDLQVANLKMIVQMQQAQLDRLTEQVRVSYNTQPATGAHHGKSASDAWGLEYGQAGR